MAFFRNTYVERDIERDAKERAIIENRQRNRTAIMDRLLDGKQRSIGLDMPALEAQVAERAARRAADVNDAEAERAEIKRISDTVETIQRQEEARRRELTAATAAAVKHQIDHPEERQAWDLNDPNRLKKQGSVRAGDDDARLGPSSMQVFGGEDLMAAERKKLQAVQMQTWTAQQAAEKAERIRREKEEDAKYAEWVMSTVQAVEEQARLDGGAEALMKSRQREALEFNLRLAEETRRRKEAEKEEEKMMSRVTFSTLTTRGAGMGLLAEDPSDGMSAADPRRYRPDYYRGRQVDVLGQLTEQIAERQTLKAQAAEEEAARHRAAVQEVRDAQLQERQMAAAAVVAKAKQREELEAQIREQEAKRKAEKMRDKMQPGFGPEFFGAFGRSLK